MKIQSVAVVLTLVNLVILTIIIAQMRPASAEQQQQKIPSVLRGRALEIVDSFGRIRASITIQPAVELDGKKYPETALLRLIESHGKPIVKLGAAENGGALTLIDQSDEGIILNARDSGTFIKVSNNGKEKMIQF